ncbi:MAG: DUF3179 domain-containing (seleno)protein, partial [Anaerolineales bacterium]
MTALLASFGILVAFAGAVAPGILFLAPRLNPHLWYRLDQRRTYLVGAGILILSAAVLLKQEMVWLLVFAFLLVGLRVALRPERVIRALDEPRHIPAAEAEFELDEFVLAVKIGGHARAWPRDILIAHHL